MKNKFAKLTSLLIATIVVISSCEKPVAESDLSTEKAEVAKQLSPYLLEHGQIDLESINTVKKMNGKLRVSTVSIKGNSTFTRYIIVSDDRDSKKAIRNVYLWSTNMPNELSQKEKQNFTGYLIIEHLGSGDKIEYLIKDGVKTNKKEQLNSVTTSQINFAVSSAPTHWQCVKNCVNSSMDKLSWGEGILCALAFPECCATIFLGCEIDCTFFK